MITELVAEVGPLWHERHQAALTARPRRRAVGAGAKHKPVLVESLLSTLVHLRHGATHDVLARWFGVDRSTITRATSELRPLPAQRDRTPTPISDRARSPRSSTTSDTAPTQAPLGHRSQGRRSPPWARHRPDTRGSLRRG
ncbi:transposase family protein [Streptomyces sp. NPDC001787]|uniref:helix-turn-helix domain-containing protein n=1 Tax=Streptomyces sp. NPDC001787 TaxID=3154523 RepID=UPI00331A83D1